MPRLLCLIVATILALGAAAQERDDQSALLSPLPIRDQFLLSNGFLFFSPEDAHLLQDGAWAVSVQNTDANTFAKSAWISQSLTGRTVRARALEVLADPRFQSLQSLYLVDGETHRTDISVRRAVGPHLELGVSVPVTSTGGGWSDRLIENAHRVMKIGSAGRETLRRNHETVYVHHGDTTYIRERGNGLAVGDVALSAKYELAPMEDPRVNLALIGSVELPVGNAHTLDGSGSVDAGVQLVASRDFDHSRIHASIGVLRLGTNTALGMRPQLLVTDTVALAHSMNDRTSVIAQLTISESPFRQLDIPEFSRRSYQLSMGVKRQLGRLIVNAAFIENVVTFENSADAGLAWGVSRRF